jgi:proteasome lid subunit RPN8/RPN11
MLSQSFILIPRGVYNSISRWAEEAYPHEGCGLLIGRFSESGKVAMRLSPLTNLSRELNRRTTATKSSEDARFSTLPEERRLSGGRTEFAMDPAEFNRETLAAEKEGLDVVGVVHTHPDHPSHPSLVDASQPFLAQWSNIIVSVRKGKTVEVKSWFREWDGQPFEEEEIRIQG